MLSLHRMLTSYSDLSDNDQSTIKGSRRISPVLSPLQQQIDNYSNIAEGEMQEMPYLNIRDQRSWNLISQQTLWLNKPQKQHRDKHHHPRKYFRPRKEAAVSQINNVDAPIVKQYENELNSNHHKTRRRSCEGQIFGFRPKKRLYDIPFEVTMHRKIRLANLFLKNFNSTAPRTRLRKPTKNVRSSQILSSNRDMSIVLRPMNSIESDQLSDCSVLKQSPYDMQKKNSMQAISFLVSGARKIQVRRPTHTDIYLKNIYTIETLRHGMLKQHAAFNQLSQVNEPETHDSVESPHRRNIKKKFKTMVQSTVIDRHIEPPHKPKRLPNVRHTTIDKSMPFKRELHPLVIKPINHTLPLVKTSTMISKLLEQQRLQQKTEPDVATAKETMTDTPTHKKHLPKGAMSQRLYNQLSLNSNRDKQIARNYLSTCRFKA